MDERILRQAIHETEILLKRIRQGKGRKPRTVYIGKQSKRALRRYLNHHRDDHSALWVTHPRFRSARLSYAGLLEILTR